MKRYDLKCCIFCIFSAVLFILSKLEGLISPATYLGTVSFKKHKISSNKRRSCEKLGQRTDEGHRGGNILDEETLPVPARFFAGDGSDDGSDGRHLTPDTVDVLWTLTKKSLWSESVSSQTARASAGLRVRNHSDSSLCSAPTLVSHLPSFPASSPATQKKRHQILQNTKKNKKFQTLVLEQREWVKIRVEAGDRPPAACRTIDSPIAAAIRRKWQTKPGVEGDGGRKLFLKLCSHGDILSGNTQFSAAPLHTVINSRHPIVYSPITHTVFHLLVKKGRLVWKNTFPKFFTRKGVKTARSYSWLALDVTSLRCCGGWRAGSDFLEGRCFAKLLIDQNRGTNKSFFRELKIIVHKQEVDTEKADPFLRLRSGGVWSQIQCVQWPLCQTCLVCLCLCNMTNNLCKNMIYVT